MSSASSYFYHDGSSAILATAGWYKTGALSSAGAVRLTPETYLQFVINRDQTLIVVVSGSVPVEIVGTGVVSAASAQDNQLVNPYPAALSLDASGLTDVVTSSPNPFSPGDQVLLFANEGTGINRSSLASYFYHDGSSAILATLLVGIKWVLWLHLVQLKFLRAVRFGFVRLPHRPVLLSGRQQFLTHYNIIFNV